MSRQQHPGRSVRRAYGEHVPPRVNLTKIWREYQDSEDKEAKIQEIRREHGEKVVRNVLATDCIADWWDNYMAPEIDKNSMRLEDGMFDKAEILLDRAIREGNYDDYLQVLRDSFRGRQRAAFKKWEEDQKTGNPSQSYSLLSSATLPAHRTDYTPGEFLMDGIGTATNFIFSILQAIPELYRNAHGQRIGEQAFRELAQQAIQIVLHISRLNVDTMSKVEEQLFSGYRVDRVKEGTMEVLIDGAGRSELVVREHVWDVVAADGSGENSVETTCPASAAITRVGGKTVTQEQGDWAMQLISEYVLPHLDELLG